MNHRVKGTEKFWDDGDGGEAILQVRAPIVSGDRKRRLRVAFTHRQSPRQRLRQENEEKKGNYRKSSYRSACQKAIRVGDITADLR